MIGSLRGLLVEIRPPKLLVEVSGVGYELESPWSTFENLPTLGSEVLLCTHLVVREDSHYLYGFLSESERDLFRTLIRTSGVGAKLALSILSGLTVDEFARAVSSRDLDMLKRLPGIGQKTAERIVVELTDKLDVRGDHAKRGMNIREEAESALIALGYKPREVSTLLAGLSTEGQSCEQVVREALRRTFGAES